MRKIRNGVRVTPCLLYPDVLTSFLCETLFLIDRVRSFALYYRMLILEAHAPGSDVCDLMLALRRWTSRSELLSDVARFLTTAKKATRTAQSACEPFLYDHYNAAQLGTGRRHAHAVARPGRGVDFCRRSSRDRRGNEASRLMRPSLRRVPSTGPI